MSFLKLNMIVAVLFLASCSGSDSEHTTIEKFRDTTTVSSVTLGHKGREVFDPEKMKKFRATAFIFLSPDCPLCQGYAKKIKEMAEKFKPDSVAFYGVFPKETYRVSEIDSFMDQYHLDIAYFIDEKMTLVNFLGASVTPEAVLVNRAGEKVYNGRIDNWAYDLGNRRAVVTEHELDDAIAALVTGKQIKIKSTKAIGCIIEK